MKGCVTLARTFILTSVLCLVDSKKIVSQGGVMLFHFGNALVFLLLGTAFVAVSLLVSALLRPQNPSPQKLAPYECGEIPQESAWISFNIRFYVLALVFVIFDVEIALILPVATVFKTWLQNGQGTLAVIEMGIFVFILLLGLVYVWVKGDLEWVKLVTDEKKEATASVMKKASSLP